jgi:glutamate/tyrosine decarboxylase-like PLP-dependent enzyme
MLGGALGEAGQSLPELEETLKKAKARNLAWYGPRMFRPSYFAGTDVLDVATKAFNLFASENWLYGRTSYPALGEFEDDVLDTLYDLFHAPAGAAGILTSGGTESLIEAVHIARDKARAEGKSGRLNIVIPNTAHPALDKATHLLDMDVRRAPPQETQEAELDWLMRALDENTVLLVGSAPPYPFGEVDPIDRLAKLAKAHSVRLHVDACLGGMILPFAEMLGRQPPLFDFRIDGVSSLSVDLHKFGYSAKGISALIFREADDATFTRTVFTDWPSGMYGTPSISGTRPGGALASAWAVMRYLGRDGFMERTRKIYEIRDEFIERLRALDASIIGRPDCYHFNFALAGLDNLLLAAELSKEGWIVSSTEKPAAVQLMITAAHEGVAQSFANIVGNIAMDIRKGKRTGGSESSVYSKVVVRQRLARGSEARRTAGT